MYLYKLDAYARKNITVVVLLSNNTVVICVQFSHITPIGHVTAKLNLIIRKELFRGLQNTIYAVRQIDKRLVCIK